MNHTSLIQILDVASQYGISSLKQLSVFLLFTDYEGCDLSEATGLTPDTTEFKAYMTTLNKLMKGSRYRGYDGLKLHEYGEQTVGKQRAVLLTGKGRELAHKIAEKTGYKSSSSSSIISELFTAPSYVPSSRSSCKS